MPYRAPGRVNIIGEHTDYNDGFVLPTTTAAHTTVRAEARNDRVLRLESINLGETCEYSLDDIVVSAAPGWGDYARGVAAEIEAAGVTIPGARLVIDGNIPIGGGLSSSASFELAIAVALLDLANTSMQPDEIAKLCQRAEIRFAGVNCGIMDQMAVAACQRDHAMLLDCRTLEAKHCAIPSGVRLLVVDSGVRHQLPQSGYNDRATECRAAADILAVENPGVTALRDATIDMVNAESASFDDVLLRRARHVVSENRRVLEACDALETNDISQLGELVSASHASLRDDFEISCKPVDDLVDIADACDGSFGSRQVGGGFGGCVLVIVSADAVDDVRAKITKDYSAILGSEPWTHIVSGADPAGHFQE